MPTVGGIILPPDAYCWWLFFLPIMMVQRLRRRGENTKSELRLVVNNVRRQDLVAIVTVILVFLGSPCQTKGFRFCFGPVWLYFGVSGGLRGSILGVLGLHFGTLGGSLASILGALGVS